MSEELAQLASGAVTCAASPARRDDGLTTIADTGIAAGSISREGIMDNGSRQRPT